MNITEALDRACQEPSLLDALTWMAVWENDRAVHQALRNKESGERAPEGGLWETCFRHSFQRLLEQRYRPKRKRVARKGRRRSR